MRVVHDQAPPENAGCWCWTTFLEHGLHEFHYAIVAWLESEIIIILPGTGTPCWPSSLEGDSEFKGIFNAVCHATLSLG